MSKEDKARAERGEVHRDGTTVKMDPCPVEGCSHFVDPKSELDLCTECDRIGRVVNYGTTRILLQLGIIRKRGDPPKQKLPGGAVLLVPKAGLEKAAIEEAAAAAAAARRREELAKERKRP